MHSVKLRGRRHALGIACALAVLLGAAGGGWSVWKNYQRKFQRQTDPRIATVWVEGITFGSQQTLVSGSSFQRWLNAHGVHAFGDYTVMQSRYSGDPGGMEIW